MGEPFRVVMVGIDYPHAGSWRETLAMMPEIELVGLVPGRFDNTGADARSAAPVPPSQVAPASAPRFETVPQALDGVDFDGAMVMLSNDDRPAACEELASAGKHIFAEKPVARDAAGMQRIADAMRDANVSFATGYTWRYFPASRDLRDLIQAGGLGRVYSMQASILTSTVKTRGPQHFIFDKETSGGGMFLWLGCHYLDMILYLINERVTSVTATVATVGEADVDVEDGGVATLQFESGALASLICGYYLVHIYGSSRYAVQGTQGWAEFVPSENELHYCSLAENSYEAPERHVQYELEKVPGYGGKLGRALIRDWIQTSREGGETLVSADAALRVLKVIDAIYESSATGQKIEVCI